MLIGLGIPHFGGAQMVYFFGLTKRTAVRKALNHWYKNLRDDLTIKDFFNRCAISKQKYEYIIKYVSK